MSESNQEKKWLIKNNNQIIGPFTEDEVKEELGKDYISPFATACVPGQEFWGFLAVYPEFAGHTDITKLTQLTKTLQSTLLTTTDRFTQTPIPQQTATEEKPPAPVVPDQIIPEHTIKTTQQKKLNLLISVLTLVIVVITGGVYMFYRQPAVSKEDSMKFVLSSTARARFTAGDYYNALRVWKQADRENALNPKDQVLFHALQFQLENNIARASSLTATATKQKEGVYSASVEKMVQALVQLKTGDPVSASVGRILTGLAFNDPSPDIKKAAFANLALFSVKAGDCGFWDRYNESAFGNKNLVNFAFSLCLLKKESVSPEDQDKAEQILKSLAQSPAGAYYQEALVGLTYINTYKKDPSVLPLIETLLDSDPYLTQSHYYDILINRGSDLWPQMLPLCEHIYSSKREHKMFIAFYGYCLLRAGRHELARKFIKQAELIDSTNILIKSVHAYITDIVNLQDEFMLILGRVIQLDTGLQHKLPYILQARFCEESKDWSCATQNWSLVLKHTPDCLSGLAGLAHAKYRQGYNTEAKEYMDRGFALDTERLYTPLLFVQNKLKVL